jgi:prevent-host-death family protein
MREVGAVEARDTFAQLLDLVERGKEVSITRHGAEVARLVPGRRPLAREQARAAIQRLRERAESRKFGPFDWAEWKAHRDEGRA